MIYNINIILEKYLFRLPKIFKNYIIERGSLISFSLFYIALSIGFLIVFLTKDTPCFYSTFHKFYWIFISPSENKLIL